MTSLDEELAGSAPPAPIHGPALDRELGLVIAEAELSVTSQRPRRRTRLAISGLIAAGAIGLGTAVAGAAGILPWFDTAPASVVRTSNGAVCEVSFGVKEVDDPGESVDAVTRAAALAKAKEFLADLDVSSIDMRSVARGLRPRATTRSESGPAESVEDYETYALLSVVSTRLQGELEQRDLPTTAVGVSMAASCDGGTQ